MTDANFACSTSSTSSRTSAWPFECPAGSNRSMSSTYCRACSSCAVFPSTFVPTTARSSSPKPCRNGSPPSGLRRLTSRPAVRGRTALSKASTRACATNCSMLNLPHNARGADRHRELAAALQYGSPARLDRLPGAGPRGVRARTRRMAGCATPTRFAGHAPAGATPTLN